MTPLSKQIGQSEMEGQDLWVVGLWDPFQSTCNTQEPYLRQQDYCSTTSWSKVRLFSYTEDSEIETDVSFEGEVSTYRLLPQGWCEILFRKVNIYRHFHPKEVQRFWALTKRKEQVGKVQITYSNFMQR